MENNKIDRLFEDKLSRHEVDPSPAAWEAVHAQINTNKRPVMIWYRVAAAVAAVAVVAVLVLRKDTDDLKATSSAIVVVDYPKQTVPFVWEVPTSASQEVKEVAPVQPKTHRQNVPVIIEIQSNVELAQEALPIDVLPNEAELLELSNELDAMAQVTETYETESIQAPPGVSVQITYKATPPVMVDEKSTIEKLWAKAKEIRPGEVLGNLRETKNDFFNGKKN